VVPRSRRKVREGEPFGGPAFAAAAYTNSPFQLLPLAAVGSVTNARSAAALSELCSVPKCGVIAPDVIIAEANEDSFNNPATGLIAFDRLRQQVPEQPLDRFPVIVDPGSVDSARVVTLATPLNRNDDPG
jgi:hypothetical protein